VGFSGAAALCGLGAARMGAGLVTVAAPESINQVLEAKLTEPMTFPLADSGYGEFAVEAASEAITFIEGKSALAMGPGIGRGEGAAAVVRAVLAEARCPVVVDADGLNVLAGDLAPLKDAAGPVIVTPHPGEMARLMRVSTKQVQRDRLASAQKLAEKASCIVVLKGARTVVALPDGRVSVCTAGNPGMASGGMGDVLTGMIAGALAQKMEPFVAARLGVFVHATAADRVAASRGERGLLGLDVAHEVPPLLREMELGLFDDEAGFIPGRPRRTL
jgi:NAD(P)H-hydrate epimerase